MNWNALGAIGEIIGALAVFATLLYLAMQIRQNTKASRSSAVHSSVTSVMDIKNLLIQDDELAELYIKGSSNPDQLNEKEWLQFRLILSNVMWASWNLYSQRNLADLSSSVWESQIPAIHRALATAGGERYWKEFGSEFDDEFRSEVHRILCLEPINVDFNEVQDGT